MWTGRRVNATYGELKVVCTRRNYIVVAFRRRHPRPIVRVVACVPQSTGSIRQFDIPAAHEYQKSSISSQNKSKSNIIRSLFFFSASLSKRKNPTFHLFSKIQKANFPIFFQEPRASGAEPQLPLLVPMSYSSHLYSSIATSPADLTQYLPKPHRTML